MSKASRRLVGGLAAAIAAAGIAFAVAPLRAAELLMVENSGCIWCVRWHAEIGPAYPRTDEGRRAPLRRIDIADAPAVGIRFTAPLTVTPTFVLVEDRREVGRITGYPGPDFFWSLLGELLAQLPAPPRAPDGLRQTHLGNQGRLALN
jgi:hypothetical protein